VFIHNLNHVSVFLLTLRLYCLPSGQPALAYPSPTYLVGLSTYVIKFFLNLVSLLLPSHQSFCFVFFSTNFFYSSPPPCLVTHFSLFPTLFTFLTCFSQLASLPVCICSLCGLCCLCCWVSCTDAGGDVVLLYYTVRTIPKHRQ
jgi:hypothetical protein